MRMTIRYIAAILIALVVGEIVAIPAAIFIDVVAGSEVTGGRWPLNIANVILVCFKGSVVGCVAGLIAKKRGILISAIAVFLPLQIFIALEIIKNRDMSEYISSIYDTKPALWMWIALIPAMISGHFTAKAAQQGRYYVVAQGAGAIFYSVAGIGLFVLHLYATNLAYEISGGIAAFITFSMPPLSDIYWLINIWHSTGAFLNLYTLRLLACGFLVLISGALLVLGEMLETRGTRSSATRKSNASTPK